MAYSERCGVVRGEDVKDEMSRGETDKGNQDVEETVEEVIKVEDGMKVETCKWRRNEVIGQDRSESAINGKRGRKRAVR